MTNLKITTSIVNGEYVISAHVETLDGFPTDIFIFENLGTGLGEYQGVCTLEEYTKYTTYTGTPIPVFANKFVKFTSATIHIPFPRDPVLVKNKLVQDVIAFKNVLNLNNQVTETIPV